MISIIICSRTEKINQQLYKNIEESVGVVYELIVIDNSNNQYSIFEAYNLGIRKSIGDYLCFIHDDILFHTKDWGLVITSIFTANPQYGLLGIAGSSQKTSTPSGWWDCEDKYKSVNIIQHYTDGKIIKENVGFEQSNLNEVVLIDGVFLVLRKELNIFFDETLQGFHHYDLNLAIETRKKGYKIGATNQVLIEHFSWGNLNNQWITSTIKIHSLYKDLLPMSVHTNYSVEAEIFAAKRFLNYCFKSGSKKLILQSSFSLYLLNPMSKYNFVRFIKSLLELVKI
ncbi:MULTISPECIES: glycosyltransferase [unclassified Flavobacterium]|uniref:glycosyltransferase n=1 Tax=unclassified Flavobacterium TaxID=196869 RepID=UPI003F917E72